MTTCAILLPKIPCFQNIQYFKLIKIIIIFFANENKIVSTYFFGWFNTNALSIKFDPPIEEFEESFKQSIRFPLKKIEKFEKVFGICKNFLLIFYNLMNKSKIPKKLINWSHFINPYRIFVRILIVFLKIASTNYMQSCLCYIFLIISLYRKRLMSKMQSMILKYI